jgi:hypothetical protein
MKQMGKHNSGTPMDLRTTLRATPAKAAPPWIERLSRVNRELWLVLSLFVIAALLNWLVESHRMVLGFYTLPTLFSAYVYGEETCGIDGCRQRASGDHCGPL